MPNRISRMAAMTPMAYSVQRDVDTPRSNLRAERTGAPNFRNTELQAQRMPQCFQPFERKTTA
jgi:hypothetical protein